MAKRTGTRELKHPILKEVDYASITKNKKSVLEIEGSELEGKTWREFQLYLGERLPITRYYFTIKFKKGGEIFSGMTNAVTLDQKKLQENNSMETDKIINEFKSLKQSLDKATNTGGISFEMLLASTKQGYEAQISYLNQRLSDKDTLISEIKREVEQLEDDLNDCEKESAKNSSIGKYLEIGEKIASVYLGGKTKTPISLKESNTSDIPDQILQVLGVIEWTKIDPESITRIANSIQQYLSVLPKEYFKGA